MTKKRRAFETEEEYSTLIERDLTALARRRQAARRPWPRPGGRRAGLAARPAAARRRCWPASGGGQERDGAGARAPHRAGHRARGARRTPACVEVTAAGIFARTANAQGRRRAARGVARAARPAAGTTIVFVRDVALVQGTSLVPVLIRALRAGRPRFIFETELRRANELLRSDEALAERLHLLVVNEPTLERARWILGRVAEELEVGARRCPSSARGLRHGAAAVGEVPPRAAAAAQGDRAAARDGGRGRRRGQASG